MNADDRFRSSRMRWSFVEGKISRPSLSLNVVVRGRLFARLTEAVTHELTIIDAPAGWGKTLLVASWLNARVDQLPAAWLSLDANDDDPVRFWSYFLAALRLGVGIDDDQPLGTLRPPQDPEQDLDVFLSLLLSSLVEMGQRIVFVIDDVHHLQDERIVGGLSFLLRHSGGALHFVLLGRHHPALPVARMRLTGQVSELSADDLAFTVAETSELLEPEGITIDGAQTQAVCDRTEGWAAGLRMTAMMLSSAGGPAAFIAGFAGRSEPVADYLLSEVMAMQPADIRDFLLRTAISDRITPSLATALTGRTDAAEVLGRLAARSVFTVAVTPDHSAFRYHQMFAEVLRDRLRRTDPALAIELHKKAAVWCQQHELMVDAVTHLADAGDWVAASDLVLSAWLRIYLAGEVTLLSSLIRRVIPNAAASRPALHAVMAVMHLSAGDAVGAEHELAASRLDSETLSPDIRRKWTLATNIAGAELARLRVDVEAARRSAFELLADEPGAGLGATADARAVALFNLGVTEYWAGSVSAAECNLREALTLADGAGRTYLKVACQSQLAGVLTAQDRPVEAYEVARDATCLAERHGWSESGVAAEAWHALGWANYLFGELATADTCLDRAEDAVRKDESAVRATIRLVQGLVLSIRGNRRAALAAVDEAYLEMHRVRAQHVFAPYVLGERIRLNLMMGRPAQSKRLLADTLAHPDADRWRHILVVRAELLLADQDPRQARRMLTRAVSDESVGFLDQYLQAKVLLAIVQRQLGQPATAVETMAEALTGAAQQRMIQPFLQFGHSAYDLVRAARQDAVPEFATQVEVAFHELLPANKRPDPTGQQITEREFEVLRMLDSLLTLPELAAELYVSVNTVKAHLKSVYRKLDVSSRRQAVDRARELTLL